MRKTVNEWLPIKNEIMQVVNALLGKSRFRVAYHEVLNDGVVVEGRGEMDDFDTYLPKVKAAFRVSNLVNTHLAAFNTNNGVGETVRDIKNTEELLGLCDVALEGSEASKRSSVEVNGGLKVITEVEVRPLDSRASIKLQIKGLKKRKRELQARLSKLNALELEIPLEAADLDYLEMEL